MYRLALIGLTVLVGACPGPGSPATETTTPVEASRSDNTAKPVKESMHQQLVLISAVQEAVIQGELEAAKNNAANVWQDGDASLPASWQPYVESVRTSMRMVAEATELDAAAQATAAMARACGDCHQAHRIVALPSNITEGPAPRTGSLAGYMQRHQWAADRLWQGLIGPSDQAWIDGASALAADNVDPSGIPESIMLRPEMPALLEQVKRVAESAAPETSPATRQRIYGEFLSTCASCHRAFIDDVD